MEELNNADKTDDDDDTGKTMKSLNFQSLAKEVSTRWRNIDKVTKEKYEAKAEENRRLYHIAVAKFKEETLGLKPKSGKGKNGATTPSSQENDDTSKQDGAASKTGDVGVGEEDVQMQEGEDDEEMDESEEEGGSGEDVPESTGVEEGMDESEKGNDAIKKDWKAQADESEKGNDANKKDWEAQAKGRHDSDEKGEESGNHEKEGAAADDDNKKEEIVV